MELGAKENKVMPWNDGRNLTFRGATFALPFPLLTLTEHVEHSRLSKTPTSSPRKFHVSQGQFTSLQTHMQT
jgi:hypothetical protein